MAAALDAIPECGTHRAGYNFSEFPLTDPVFTNKNNAPGSQGLDRVIAIAPNIGLGRYSLVYLLSSHDPPWWK